MAKTKSVKVDWVKKQVHTMLRESTCSPEIRLGFCSVLEQILHKTGNYNGFQYLDWLDGGCERWNADGRPKDNTPYLGDQSRRFYY